MITYIGNNKSVKILFYLRVIRKQKRCFQLLYFSRFALSLQGNPFFYSNEKIYLRFDSYGKRPLACPLRAT